MFICHSHIFSGDLPLKVIDPFFGQIAFLPLNFKSSLYILDSSLDNLGFGDDFSDITPKS